MIPEDMTQCEANVELQKIKAEAVASFGGYPHSGAETQEIITREWHKFCGVPFVAKAPELPVVEPVPAIREVMPDGIPGPVRVATPEEVIPSPVQPRTVPSEPTMPNAELVLGEVPAVTTPKLPPEIPVVKTSRSERVAP